MPTLVAQSNRRAAPKRVFSRRNDPLPEALPARQVHRTLRVDLQALLGRTVVRGGGEHVPGGLQSPTLTAVPQPA